MCNKPPRFYWKCHDCLTPFAVDGEYRSMSCACGGSAWCMGQVTGARLSKSVFRCPCDGRCTGATGPSCDCSCGGENHGSNLLVEVAVDAGPVPSARVTVDAKSLARAEEYRAAIAPLLAECKRLRSGKWLGNADYSRLCDLEHTIGYARKSKTHGDRMKALLRLSSIPA